MTQAVPRCGVDAWHLRWCAMGKPIYKRGPHGLRFLCELISFDLHVHTSITASARTDPSGCGMPWVMEYAMSVRAFPMSICPHAILKARPSNEIVRVNPVIACFEAV